MAAGGSKANGKLARSVIRGKARRLRGFMERRRREEEEKKGTQRCKGARTQREEGNGKRGMGREDRERGIEKGQESRRSILSEIWLTSL
jgi:hypothetical protein